MHRFFATLDRIINHPYAKIAVALCLVATSGFEIHHEMELSESKVGAHHGLFVYGIALVVSALAEVSETAVQAHHSLEKDGPSHGV